MGLTWVEIIFYNSRSTYVIERKGITEILRFSSLINKIKQQPFYSTLFVPEKKYLRIHVHVSRSSHNARSRYRPRCLCVNDNTPYIQIKK